jgi:hypothetical protein
VSPPLEIGNFHSDLRQGLSSSAAHRCSRSRARSMMRARTIRHDPEQSGDPRQQEYGRDRELDRVLDDRAFVRQHARSPEGGDLRIAASAVAPALLARHSGERTRLAQLLIIARRARAMPDSQHGARPQPRLGVTLRLDPLLPGHGAR